ncbi:MAG: hypothetical protein HKO56_08415, partial [Bacteroidia bacterium]|nr:hypothetical protein [Bacteroidia bacterium]
CNGDSNGTIDITASGGLPLYTYDWLHILGPINPEDLTGLAPGNYTAIVTDANLCTDTIFATIIDPPVMAPSALPTDVSCNGGNDGSIDLTPVGGVSPSTYVWSNASTNEDLTGLVPGTYTVTVTDAHGCTETTSATINEPAAIGLTESHTDVSCNAGSDGAIDITPSGGTTPYIYSWSHGVTTEDASGIAAGTYTVTVTDAGTCTVTISATLTEPTVLIVTETHVDVSCNGGGDGSINISPSGGTAAYSYLWSNAATSEDISGLAAGTYTVTVTDALSCTVTISATLTEPTSLTVTETHVDVSCDGGSDGSIDISPSGGTAAYSYLWSNAATSEDISGLGAGTYTVTVTDALSCTVTISATLTEPAVLAVTETHIDVSCNGGSDGSIDITPSGGTVGYSYSWSNGATTEDISGLAIGPYTVTITDALSCTVTISATIAEPTALTVTETHIDVSCNGGSDGSIDISPAGGTAAYSYNWSNGATTEDVSGLAIGSYTVTVTDAQSCTTTISATIAEPTALTVTVTHIDVSCNGGSDGSIDISPSGGTTSYSYNWSNGATTEDISGLTMGSYTVTITDAQSCTVSISATLTEPASLTLSETNIDVICYGASTGSINLTVAGGVQLNEKAADLLISEYGEGNVVGNDWIEIYNGTGSPVDLSDYELWIVYNGGFWPESTIALSGMLANDATYIITHPSASPILLGQADVLSAFMNFTGDDAIGLARRSNTTLLIDSLIDAVGNTPFDPGTGWSVAGTFNGTVDRTLVRKSTVTSPTTNWNASRGTTPANSEWIVNPVNDFSDLKQHTFNPPVANPPYSFLWSNGATTEDLSSIPAAVYTVTVTDGNSCTATLTAEITSPDSISVADSLNHVTCQGGTDGSIYLTLTGGTPGFIFDWAHQSGPSNPKNQTNLAVGTYSLTITDANGCTKTAAYSITEAAALAVTESHNNVLCFGGNDGDIDITSTGGTPPYTYSWSSGETTEDINTLIAGTYTVTVTDNNSCSDVLIISITEPALLT